MNSKQRLCTVLDHRLPDRIPFDLGGTAMTGIHVNAYRKLLQHLGFDGLEIEICDIKQQLALPHEEVMQRLGVDIRSVRPSKPDTYHREIIETEDYHQFVDDWGIRWSKPKAGGFYYDMVSHPLEGATDPGEVDDYPWIDAEDDSRYRGIEEAAARYSGDGYGVAHWSICAGVSEMHAWLRGFENYYLDFYLNPDIAGRIMDKVVDIKITYWRKTLSQSGENIDVVVEADDLAGQERPLISPKTYREFIKPRHSRLFNAIKEAAPHVKIFLHSCGAVYDFVADFIESGVDILNPVQKSAAGMDLGRLKAEFGDQLVFWGGGVDTQRVFDGDDIDAVRQDVRESIRALKPGGGFVFTPVHNTQPNVPPENYMAMWEVLQDHGCYS